MNVTILVSMLFAASTDPGGDFLKVARARCAACHGPDARCPKDGQFLYILDLKRLAADRSKVIPGDPVNSTISKLVQSGNMPPNDSPTGPLNDAQKAAVQAWVVAGAPQQLPPAPPAPDPPAAEAHNAPPAADPTPEVAPSSPGAAPDDLDSTGDATPQASESFTQHTRRWSGELHLLFLHFPIACLVATVIAEGRAALRGQVTMSATGTFCLWIAAATAVPTVVCGWIYAAAGHGAASGALPWHRWLGTAGGVMTVLTVIVHSQGRALMMPAQHTIARRGFLGVAAVLVIVAAHFGGKAAFGPGFLGW